MSPRIKLVVGAVAVAVAVAGLRSCASRTDRSPDEPVASDSPAAPSEATGSRSEPVDGHLEPAGAAAVAAVAATGDVAAAGFITRADMIRELATVRFAPSLIDESSAQLDAMTAELTTAGIPAATVRFHELPLTADVTELGPSRATVEVWSVTIVTVADRAAPRQLWRTVTVTVAFDDDRQRWLVDDWTTKPGPTPSLAVDSEIAATAEVDAVLGWTPVGGD